MLGESVVDLNVKFYDAVFSKEEKEKKLGEFFADAAIKACQVWEGQLKAAGGEYFFGKKVWKE